MKNILRLVLFCGLSSFISCDESYRDLIPTEYNAVLYIDGENMETITIYESVPQYTKKVIVAKTGANPQATAKATFELLSREELELYSLLYGVTYKHLPAPAYSLNEESLKFDSNERYKNIDLIFNTSEIIKAIENDPKATFVLPLKLVSEENKVNEDMNMLFYTIETKSAQVVLEMPTNNIRHESMLYKSLDLEIEANLENIDDNPWDFSCSLLKEIGHWTELVAAYNQDNRTNYETMPEGAVSFEQFEFEKGMTKATISITIQRELLTSDKTYLLPIVLNDTSLDGVDLSSEIMYILLDNPKYGVREINQTDKNAMKILYCNSDCTIKYTDPADDWNYNPPTDILDGDIGGGWCGAWDTALATTFANSDDYDYENAAGNEWHTFLGRRLCRAGVTNPTTIAIVIDLGRTMRISEIGFMQGFGAKWNASTYMQRIKNFDISLSEDDEFLFKTYKEVGNLDDYFNPSRNNWKQIASFINAARTPEIQWTSVSKEMIDNGVAQGQLLKLHFSETWENEISMTELYIKEIVSIDGEPIN